MRTLITGVLALLVAAAAIGQMPKYRVTTKADKHTDFTRLKTYAWEPGWASYDAAVDEQIVAAVDRELAAVGLTKGTLETCDVKVVYAAMRRTDVDVKGHGIEGERRTYPVGTLVVLMRDPSTHKELFRGRTDTPIELDSGTLTVTIASQVAEMFEHYPGRRSNHQ